MANENVDLIWRAYQRCAGHGGGADAWDRRPLRPNLVDRLRMAADVQGRSAPDAACQASATLVGRRPGGERFRR